MKHLSLILIIAALCSCNKTPTGSQGENFTNNVNQVAKTLQDDSDQLTFFANPRTAITPALEAFPTGSVQPRGWIKHMMQEDLQSGIVGALEDLYPGIHADDLYRTARRGGMEDIPEMGDLVLTGAEWETSIMWWNAETIGNWWDGFIRHAFLTEDQTAMEKSHAIVQNLLQSQDEDGYIGIYQPNLRYQHEGSNGELWAQTTAFRTLLAYYEFTQKEEVLAAVEEAMTLTMERYGESGNNPFELKNAFGGVTHGLMLTDVCETLYRITDKQAYQDYATYLYQAFSTYSINRSFNDLRYPFLAEKEAPFEGHAVHTYEHIRTLANAYYHTGYPELEEAYHNMLHKLDACLLPSGAGHGNEWIAKLEGDPDHTGSEYCAMLELRNSYGSLIQKTGSVAFADQAETLTYNAMLGSRNLNGTAIAYGKLDNSVILDGKHHEAGESRPDPRYKYSPTHSEPAVCCVPNYGRNLSYFLDQMWMKTEDAIVAVMYGPSELTTSWNGSKVVIEQETDYPLSDVVRFRFTLDSPQEFTFKVRIPNWSEGIQEKDQFDGKEDGYHFLTKTWQTGDELTLTFNNPIQRKPARNGEHYLQRGPIVYAYEIPHKEESIKTYDKAGFRDYHCFPKQEDHAQVALSEDADFSLKTEQHTSSFYESEVYLEGSLLDKQSNQRKAVQLVPMGKTVLRRVTFPKGG